MTFEEIVPAGFEIAPRDWKRVNDLYNKKQYEEFVNLIIKRINQHGEIDYGIYLIEEAMRGLRDDFNSRATLGYQARIQQSMDSTYAAMTAGEKLSPTETALFNNRDYIKFCHQIKGLPKIVSGFETLASFYDRGAKLALCAEGAEEFTPTKLCFKDYHEAARKIVQETGLLSARARERG